MSHYRNVHHINDTLQRIKLPFREIVNKLF